MEEILQWGLDFIRLIQSRASPPLTFFMKLITGLGSAQAYIFLIPLVYWCYDEKKALRLGTAVLISAWLNFSLKFLLNQPRPFFAAYDPALGMIGESLGGFPSGHAQNSLVLWVIAASWGKKKWYFAIAALFCLLISFSRIYLGVHFPTDILGGWVLGGLVLCVYFLFGKRIEQLLEQGGFRGEMIATAAAAFVMILYCPAEKALMPGAVLLGMGAGYCLNRRYIDFKPSPVVGKTGAAKCPVLFIRSALGIAGTVLIYAAFGKILAGNEHSSYYRLLYFFRFAVLALWISAGAPWLFCSLRLARNKTEDSPGDADN
jgi:membrane-associated phospholipid phosphatase